MATEERLIDAVKLQEAFYNTFYPDEVRRTIYFGNDVHRAVNFFAKKSRELITNAPTVDAVEVAHGEWISDEGDVLFHCSECDTQISTSWDYDDLHWNYCPNCGAKMDGKRK